MTSPFAVRVGRRGDGVAAVSDVFRVSTCFKGLVGAPVIAIRRIDVAVPDNLEQCALLRVGESPDAHFNASVRAAVIANRASSRYCSFASGFNFDHNGATSSKPMPDVPV